MVDLDFCFCFGLVLLSFLLLLVLCLVLVFDLLFGVGGVLVKPKLVSCWIPLISSSFFVALDCVVVGEP